HARHDKTITQDEVADLQRRKQGIEHAQIPSSTLAIYWKTKQKTWPVRARSPLAADVPGARLRDRPHCGRRAARPGSVAWLGVRSRPLYRRTQLDRESVHLPGQHARVARLGRRRAVVALP